MTDKTIVIYRLGSLGDTIVALPCFHQIARSFPDHKRLVLTNEPVSSSAPSLESVLLPSGLIDGVVTYQVGERSKSALFRLFLKLRATGADTMIYLAAGRGQEAIRRDLRFFRWCGFSRIIGAPRTDDLHDHRRDPGEASFEPEAERLARTIATLGAIDLQDRANWDLRLTEEEHAAADEALKPLGDAAFFVINIGGKAAVNDWGGARWKALFAAIADELKPLAVVGIGAGGDLARTQRLLNSWPGPRLNLCGALTPRHSAAVLGRARFFAGHDSGPLHLAAAVGIPTVGLFGSNNPPRIWHPYSRRSRPIHDMRGIDAIEVDVVRDAVLAAAKDAE